MNRPKIVLCSRAEWAAGASLAPGRMPLLVFGCCGTRQLCFAKFWTRTVLAKASENKEGHKRALMGLGYTPTAHRARLRRSAMEHPFR